MCRCITAALDLFSLQGSADSEKMLREGIFSLPPAGPPSTPLRFFAQRAAVCALIRSPIEFLQSVKCIEGDFIEPAGREEVQKAQDRSWVDSDVLRAVCSMTRLKKISGPFLTCCCLVEVDLRGLDELTAIGDCFLCNSTFERVQLPTKLESVGASFLAATRVPQLDMRDTLLSSIGTHFLAETRMRRVLLPPTVSCFGPFAFFKVTSPELVLTVPSLEEVNQGFLEFSSVQVLITVKSGQELSHEDAAQILPYEHLGRGQVACRHLDLSCTSIQSFDDTFLKQCRVLEMLVLPPTLKIVGNGLLSKVGSRKLDLSRTQLESTGPNFLDCCSTLEEVFFPATLKSIGDNFLLGCTKIETINLQTCGVEGIGDNFATKCSQLAKVMLPATLKVIGNGFLPGFYGSRKLDLSRSQLESIGSNFLKASGVGELLLPTTLKVIGDGFLNRFFARTLDLSQTQLERIGSNFLEDSHIGELLLPATVKSIENGFLKKFRCKTVDLSHTSLESIGSNFLEDSSVEELLLPATLKSIGQSFMAECQEIRNLDLSSCALTTVGNRFASNCDSLVEVVLPWTIRPTEKDFLVGFKCDPEDFGQRFYRPTNAARSIWFL